MTHPTNTPRLPEKETPIPYPNFPTSPYNPISHFQQTIPPCKKYSSSTPAAPSA
ncbi:hypothetical protein EIKCOROL_00274 [Eikenella corrodens ATCC 23834]|uniref:Uncharacterized protein n=1 Tax=Eikenella corrodens ATCC 23834 TaxID=546274 RepID=C0DSF2_EIKCO|nr:hypothetical protein EIKCOROL_00274 [Eikenella corrodens ATCC 23834]